MRRRTFLATAGALFSAGCSEVIPPPRTTVTTGTAGGTPSETANGTASATAPTDGPETTDTGPAETTDQPTEADTPTQAEQKAAQAIETARKHLSDSHSAYLAFASADDPTLLDVSATTQVSVSDVTSLATKARNALDTAPTAASTEQKETIDRLYGVADFLTTGIRYQSSANSTYSKFTFVLGRLYAEQFAILPGEISQLRKKRDNAKEFVDTLQSKTDRTDVQALDGLSATVYDQKVSQLEREVAAFQTLADAFVTISDGLETFGDANGEFTDEDYDDAAELYSTAAQQLSTANETLTALDAPDAVSTEVADLLSVTDALATGSTTLEAAASAGEEYEWDTYDAKFKAGVSELQKSQVAVDRLDSVTEIIEYYERQY